MRWFTRSRSPVARRRRFYQPQVEALESRLLLTAGDILWLRQVGGVGPAADVASATDAAGNVYVAGFTTGIFPGQTSAGGIDAYVRKYDAAGTELWTRQFGSTGLDQVSGVAVDAGGSVYVAGAAGAALPGQVSAGDNDAYVRKYNAAGTELWTRQFGTAALDSAIGLDVDAGGVYVAGATEGALPGQTSAGSTDAFARRYDAAGTELWTRQFGTAALDTANGVAVTAAGVSVAGATFGTLPGQTSAGSQDAFVAQMENPSLPTLTVPGAQTAAEDVPLAIAGLSVADVDSASLTVTVQVSHGTLTLGTTAGLTVSGNGTALVTLTGSLANLNAALASLSYRGALNYSGPDTLNITADDGCLSTNASVAITVLSPAQQAQVLAAQVIALRDAGVLTGGQANALLAKLNLQGNPGDVGRIRAFLIQVAAFVRAGILTPAQAIPLLQGGATLLASLLV
jgi:hypothetical protein